MCGINGIFAYHYAANPIDRDELLRTRDHMAARGPDGKGEWISDDGRVGLGHRRLSIIDLSDAGAQPMASADGKLVVTFNGEIYNYRELRERLEAQGPSVPQPLRHRGAAAPLRRKGRGDGARPARHVRLRDLGRQPSALFLARDPYGIKPLYYADDGWTFRFASQVKALLAGGGISRDPDPAGQVGFYLLGSVPEPFTTLSRDSRPAGGLARCWSTASARSEPRRYHSIAAVYLRRRGSVPATSRRREATQAGSRAALLDSVRHHLVADVPVGAFLSAGIDSWCARRPHARCRPEDIQTVTLSFEEFRGTPRGRGAARRRGRSHLRHAAYDRDRHRTRVRRRPAAHPRGHGPAIDRRRQHLVRLQGGAASSGSRWRSRVSAATSCSAAIRPSATFRAGSDRLAVPSRISACRPLASRALVDRRIGPHSSAIPKPPACSNTAAPMPGAYLLRRGLFMPWELEQLLTRETVQRGCGG